MKPTTPLRPALAVSAALLLPSLAQAHSADILAYDCASGALHPLHGIDHLATMIAVGVWAAQLGGRARWAVPAAFVGTMAVGAVLGAAGFSLPGLEPMMAATVLGLGLLIAWAVRLPTAAALGLTGLFALLHGVAHGAEIPAEASAFSYGVGFILATATLHLAGLGLGTFAAVRSARLSRALGALCAAAGAALLLS